MISNYFLNQYKKCLSEMPTPGGGGCHSAILGVANYGVMARLTPEKIFEDIRHAIPSGTRRISDREINDAIKKAFQDHGLGHLNLNIPKIVPAVKNGHAVFEEIINQAKIHTEKDLWELSPVQLNDDPRKDPIIFLETLFDENHLIWIGDNYDKGIINNTIRYRDDWIEYYLKGNKTKPHIIINPVNGKPSPLKSGNGNTLRGDGNTASYCHCMVEFDNMTREKQIRFWSAVQLPILALIDSGGKSIHAWLDVSHLTQVETLENWQEQIKNRLYVQHLIPLGVDSCNSNPARLSRLPGHYRTEKNNYQRILWLSPEGRPICR
jgi:hypothetical protein